LKVNAYEWEIDIAMALQISVTWEIRSVIVRHIATLHDKCGLNLTFGEN
jgi:hypothetical protein